MQNSMIRDGQDLNLRPQGYAPRELPDFDVAALCLQAWLQEFVWREADFDAKMEKRAAHNPAVREQLMKEPLFCFETAVMPALLS